MILKFDSIITKTSMGKMILQLDKDEIISVQPRDIMKKGRISSDPPIGFYGDGAFSNIIRYLIDIKCLNKTFTLEVIDDYQRGINIDYIMNEMMLFIPLNRENKFYKKDYKANQLKAISATPVANTGRKRKAKPREISHSITGNKEIL